MQEPISEFTVTLVGLDNLDQEWREQRLRSLKKELTQLPKCRVSEVRASETRDGAKSLEGALVSLGLALIANDFFLESLFGLLRDWIGRQKKDIDGIKVKVGDIEVELSGSSTPDEIANFIHKLKSTPPAKA